ncbi:hypothetical protein [Pseudoduganella chitinolytica]|uniref:Uncharacterized protein n=1 Tax=Pseudoduganella chitinolytica TaxID=34070 RepID=A0ABY8BF61_9BURK|nr:hypothetical protein [Pseudoduganella chitinolytica]WEF34535.1 hypothetical protein PX653_07155 [Pseudoduganella chitinolytica]
MAWRWLAALLLALLVGAAGAQPAAPAPAAAPAAPGTTPPEACPTPRQYGAVAVTGVTAFVPYRPGAALAEVSLRDGIVVTVNDLDTLLARERCSPRQKKIVLFLDGRPLADIRPYPPSNPVANTLNFVLNRTETSRDVWTHLLGKPQFRPRQLAVSVGIEDEYPIASQHTIALRVIPMGWFALWTSLFSVLAVAFILLARRSDVLRDPGPLPGPGRRKPYSLARTQGAVWFGVVLAAYLFIGMITGDYATTITPTVLALMGISAGTVIGSSLIDHPPGTEQVTETVGSRGWLADILSDRYGVSFHRFQMASWTLVLAIVFIQQVYRDLAMPDFDITLLGLMGISAGTYLGLKTTAEGR